MAKKKLTKAERAEWEAQPAEMRTRELAEQAQAKLGAQSQRR